MQERLLGRIFRYYENALLRKWRRWTLPIMLILTFCQDSALGSRRHKSDDHYNGNCKNIKH